MGDRNTEAEAQLRRELDLILVRLEQRGRAALIEARSEGTRLVGDMFADAQVVAARALDGLSYERLSRRAKVLTNALERLRDGSYGICDGARRTLVSSPSAWARRPRCVSWVSTRQPWRCTASAIARYAGMMESS